MLFIIIACIAIAFLWTGLGFFVHRPEASRQIPFRSFLNRFWIGWVLVIAFLQIWNLLYPIGAVAFAILLAGGLYGWFRARQPVLAQLKTWGIKNVLITGSLAAIPLLVLSSHVLYSSPHYDHGLYHLQTVRWLNNYAIVPGLGNLHHRLAFNNANLLYAAVINWGPFADRAYYLASTMLGFVLILACGNGFYQIFRAENRWRASNLYYCWMLPIVLWQFSSLFFSGYSPDMVVFILQVVIGGAFLRLTESEEKTQAIRRLAFLTLLATAGMTIKLSFIAFGFIAILAGLLYIHIRFRWHLKQDASPLLALAGIPCLLLIPWVLRNIILSGYPFFPSMALAIPVAWRIPTALTEPIAPGILYWARTVSQSIPYTADLGWFKTWWNLFPFLVVQRGFMISLLLISVNLVLAWFLRKSARPHIGVVLLFAISIISVLYWFLMAPDYRFSGAALWLLFLSNALFAAHLLIESRQVQPALLASAVLLAMVLWLNPNEFIVQRPVAGQILYPMPESELLEKQLQIEPFETRQTSSGLVLHMPQEPADQCWYAELPCTRPQDFIQSLRLIDPPNLQKGFKIEK